MNVFHATSSVAAAAIEREGFRDANFLGIATGVCVSDRPLDAADGVARHCDVVFCIATPSETALGEFEIEEEGRPSEAYREWLVPAAVLDLWPRNRHVEVDD